MHSTARAQLSPLQQSPHLAMGSKLPTSRAAGDGLGTSYPAWAEEAPGNEDDRSFLLPFGLENPSQDKSRRSWNSAVRRKILFVTAAVTAGLVIIGLLLGVGITLLKRQQRLPDIMYWNCPAGLQIQETDQVFFVIGDWGRQGSATQRRATRVITEVATRCMKPAFVISTGDNFYPNGLTSGQDPQISSSFVNMYTDPSLQVPWYAVLGNHDYGDTQQLFSSCPATPLSDCSGACCTSPLWQVSSSNHSSVASLDPRWHLEQGVYQITKGDIEFTFVDTSPVIQSYHQEKWASLPGGILSQDPSAQRERLQQALTANSSARIKLVIGHHPVRSYGQHCYKHPEDCEQMTQWLQPLLQEHKVTAYMCGHEHDLQYIRKPSDTVSYIVSGGGSDVRYGEQADTSEGEALMFDDQGFVSVLVRDGVLTLYYWTASSPDPVAVINLPAAA